MKPDSSQAPLKKSRARDGAPIPSSIHKNEDPALSAATLALVRKGLAESAAGKTVYRGSFKHYVTRQHAAPQHGR